MNWILGADGGGTKTALLCKNTETGEIKTAFGAGINYNYITLRQAAENFIRAYERLGLGPEDTIAAVAIGDPSTDDITPNDATGDFIELLYAGKTFGRDTRIFVKSDAYMALYGLTRGKAGVLMISGTGAMGIALDRSGMLHAAGGWGQLVQDPGSGYYIAVEGIRASLDACDGISEQTALLEAFIKHFSVADPRDFIRKYYGGALEESEIAKFSLEVSKCAAAGDPEAKRILDKTADYLARYVISLIGKSGAERCPVGIYGSVFQNDAYVRNTFIANVKRKYPDITIAQPQIKPEMAAVLYAEDMIRNT